MLRLTAPLSLMAYTTQAKVQAVLPAAFVTQALDDDENGSADSGLLDAIIGTVEDEINGLLTPAVTVPITGTVPYQVQTAALAMTCAALYRRRGIADEGNPWKDREDKARELMADIGAGKVAIDAAGPAGAFDDSENLLFSEQDDE